MIRRRILTAFAVVVIAAGSLVGAVWHEDVFAAQTAQVGGNSLKVSPVRQSANMDPGTKKTIAVTIQNISSVPARLHVVMNDFMAATDESGTPNIILDENQYAPSHSLKRYMTPIPDFNLPGNGSKEISLVLNVPPDAAGGGYYGAIRFEPVSESGDRTLNLSASVGSLVLIKVSGNITENLSVASFDVRQKGKAGRFFTNTKDLEAVVRFKNTGNVQVEPFGKLLVKKGHKEISSTEINDSKPPGSVLPDSIRRFTVRLDKVGPFGKYSAEGNFGYGSTGQLLTAKKTFYVVPVVLLVLIGLSLLLLLFMILILPRMIRAYNRRVVRKASRRR